MISYLPTHHVYPARASLISVSASTLAFKDTHVMGRKLDSPPRSEASSDTDGPPPLASESSETPPRRRTRSPSTTSSSEDDDSCDDPMPEVAASCAAPVTLAEAPTSFNFDHEGHIDWSVLGLPSGSNWSPSPWDDMWDWDSIPGLGGVTWQWLFSPSQPWRCSRRLS